MTRKRLPRARARAQLVSSPSPPQGLLSSCPRALQRCTPHAPLGIRVRCHRAPHCCSLPWEPPMPSTPLPTASDGRTRNLPSPRAVGRKDGVTREDRQAEDKSGRQRALGWGMGYGHVSCPRSVVTQSPHEHRSVRPLHLPRTSCPQGPPPFRVSELTLREPGGLLDWEPVDSAGIAARVQGERALPVLHVAVLWHQAGALQRDVPGRRADHRPP